MGRIISSRKIIFECSENKLETVLSFRNVYMHNYNILPFNVVTQESRVREDTNGMNINSSEFIAQMYCEHISHGIASVFIIE